MKRVYSAFILMAAIILFVASLHSSWLVFFYPASMLFVGGVVVAGALVSFPGSRLRAAFRHATREGPDREAGAAVFHRMADLAVSAGMLGSVMGLVKMLQALSDPTQLGPAMAEALLALLYGLALGELVLRSVAAGLDSDEVRRSNRRGSIHLPFAVAFLIVTIWLVMTMAFVDLSPLSPG